MKRIILLSVLVSLFISINAFAADEEFQASIVIRSAITITETSALNFGIVEGTHSPQNIQILPGGTGAASFDITGDNVVSATFSVVETTINMTDGTNNIPVVGFDLSSSGATLDPVTATTVTIGATANVPADPVGGTYTGTANFRVVYN